jgi:ribosomal protein L11 methyltransferase
MDYPFSQPKLTFKLIFFTDYKSLELFEKFFPEDILGISTCEVESSTIESADHDLWKMEIFLAEKLDLLNLTKALKDYADRNHLLLDNEINMETVEDKDWVKEYQAQLKPMEIGRFFITSSAINVSCPENKTPVYLEASRAFGTGEHETTSLCIQAMDAMRRQNITSVFDLGTGSGILSFVAEKIWPESKILACDIEPVSVEIAKNNLLYNNSHVDFYQNSEDNLSIPNKWNKCFDLVVSNILATPLISMAKTIRSITHSDSRVILSGFLDYQVEEIVAAYEQEGFILDNNLNKNRWHTAVFKVNNL